MMIALAAVVLALAIAAWIHGIYCYVQMVRHRRPGVPLFSLVWPSDFLSPRGIEFRRRALWSYAAVGFFALLLVLLGRSTET